MRGAKPSTLTEAERQEAKRLSTLHYYRRVAIPNLAHGLTAAGKTPQRKIKLAPETQRLVEEFKQRELERQQNDVAVQISPLESEWRKLRAEMGDVTVPEVEVRLRHGD